MPFIASSPPDEALAACLSQIFYSGKNQNMRAKIWFYKDSASSLVIWILIGLIAGWLAGEVTKGSGFGAVGNIIIGIVGAILGGVILGALGVDPGGFVGEVIQAFIGALVLLAIVGLARGAR